MTVASYIASLSTSYKIILTLIVSGTIYGLLRLFVYFVNKEARNIKYKNLKGDQKILDHAQRNMDY